MKTRNIVLCVAGFALVAVAATNNVPTLPEGQLPKTLGDYWDLVIAGVTPLIVSFVHYLVPKIPKLALPLMTPFVGIGLGLLLNRLTDANLGWVDMAKAGALAVFIYEVVTRSVTKYKGGGEYGPSAPKPV